MIPPVNIVPDNIFPRPKVSELSSRLKEAMLAAAPAKAMYAPAIIPRINSFLKELPDFAMPLSTVVSNISDGFK